MSTGKLIFWAAVLLLPALVYEALKSSKKPPALIGSGNTRLPGNARDTEFGGGGDYGPTGGDF